MSGSKNENKNENENQNKSDNKQLDDNQNNKWDYYYQYIPLDESRNEMFDSKSSDDEDKRNEELTKTLLKQSMTINQMKRKQKKRMKKNSFHVLKSYIRLDFEKKPKKIRDTYNSK